MRTITALLFGFALSASAAVTTNVAYTYRTLMYDTNNTITAPTNGLIYLHPLTNSALVLTNSSAQLVIYNTNGTKKEITANNNGALIFKSDSGEHLMEILDVGTVYIPFGDVYLGGTVYITNLYTYKYVTNAASDPSIYTITIPWFTTNSSTTFYGQQTSIQPIVDTNIYNASSLVALGSSALISSTNHRGHIGNLISIHTSHGTIGGAGSGDVTNSFGLYIYGRDESNTVGTLWGIYDTGNDKNYFGATSTGFGTTTPAARVAINGGLNVGSDTDPGDNNLSVVGNAYIATTGYANNLLATNTVYGNAASISNTITAGTINVATNVISANYMVGSTNGGTQTFTNYTTGSGGTGIVTNVLVFLNGLFITNTITE